MEFLTALWMPILVSAVVVWIASAITHMVLPFHKGDFSKFPDEEKVMDALAGIPGGSYMFPYCDQKDMNTPEMKEKMAKGPLGTATIWANGVNMGQNLGLTLLCYLLIGIVIAYLGHHLGLGAAPFTEKFRFAGTIALASHFIGWIPFAIWYRNIKFASNAIDGILYALITGAVFGWLWH